MSVKLTPEGTFIRNVQFVLSISAKQETDVDDFTDITSDIKNKVIKGIESISQFFTESRINSFEVTVHNTHPEIAFLMLSSTKLTQIDPSYTHIILPDKWNFVYSETEFTKVSQETKGYIYAPLTSMRIFYGFKIQVEFKNMLGSLAKNEPVMKDKKFMALFQKNNMLQALIEKETLDKEEERKQQQEERQQVINMDINTRKKRRKEKTKEPEFY